MLANFLCSKRVQITRLGPIHYYYLFFGFFFLLASHYTQPNAGGYGLQFPANSVTWIFVVLLVATASTQVVKQKQLLISWQGGSILIGSFLLFIPLFYTNYEGGVIGRLWALIAAVLFYFSITQFQLKRRQFSVLFSLIVASLAIKACWYLLQIFLPYEANADWSKPWENIFFDEIIANFQQPNSAAVCFVVGLALVIGLNILFQASKKFLSLSALAPICLSGLFSFCVALLQSRTAYIALAFVSLALAVVFFRSARSRIFAHLLMVSLCFIIGLQSIGASQERNRDLNMDKLVTDSPRSSIAKVSMHMIREKPLVGWGYGQFEKRFLEESAAIQSKTRHHGLAHPHNEVLFWMIEGGIVPVIGLLLMLFGYLRASLICIDRYKLWILVSTAPLFLHLMLEYPFYTSAFSFVIFVVLISSQDSGHAVKAVPVCSPFVFQTIIYVGTLAVGIYMLGSLQASYWYSKYIAQGSTEPKLLQKIVESSSHQSVVVSELYRWRMIEAIKAKNHAELANYVQWAERYVKKMPHRHVLSQLAYALFLLGREDDARMIFDRGKFLYPGVKRFQSFELFIGPQTPWSEP